MQAAAIATLTFLILTLASCRHPATISEFTEVTPAQLRDCAEKMQITFPSGTRSVGMCKQEGWQDDTIWLKVQIPKKDLLALLESSPFAKEMLSNERRYITSPGKIAWWKAEAVTNFKSGQANLPEAKYVNILIDLDDEEIIAIYLMWQET